MTLVTAEVGVIAANEVRRILVQGTRDRNQNDIVVDDPDDMWNRFVSGGWVHIASPEAGTDVGVREIQEVARVHGEFLVPAPLMTTMLVGRWFAPSEDVLDGGATFAIGAADGVVLHPRPGRPVFGLDGRRDESPAAETSQFAASLPLATGHPAPGVSPEHTAEALAVLAAEGVGCADAVLRRSLEWASTREQFGRTISGFQAIRHHLANMHVAREEAWTAALAAASNPDLAARWALLSLRRSRTAVELGIQVHGGVGFTWEAALHNWLRHLLQLSHVVRAAT